MRWFSTWLLEAVERFYLWAHFWERRNGFYYPPESYGFERKVGQPYRRSHAVNSQKQLTYNPIHGGWRTDPDKEHEHPVIREELS